MFSISYFERSSCLNNIKLGTVVTFKSEEDESDEVERGRR